MRTPEQVAEELVRVEHRRDDYSAVRVGKAPNVYTGSPAACDAYAHEVRKEVAAAVREAREETFRHALGEAPVTREGLKAACVAVIDYLIHESEERVPAEKGFARVTEYVAHLEALVAHMSADNGFNEGYEAGQARAREAFSPLLAPLRDALGKLPPGPWVVHDGGRPDYTVCREKDGRECSPQFERVGVDDRGAAGHFVCLAHNLLPDILDAYRRL